jgi:hypothetical protein
VPVIVLHGLDEAREREIVIRDNVNNGDWDFDILANEWDAEELDGWGLDIPAERYTEPNEDEEEDEEESRLIIASVSLFGRSKDEDAVLVQSISQDDVDMLLGKLKERPANEVVGAMLEAARDL